MSIQRPLSSSPLAAYVLRVGAASMSAMRIGSPDSIQELRRVSAVRAISSRCALSWLADGIGDVAQHCFQLARVTAVDGHGRCKQRQFPDLVGYGDLLQCALEDTPSSWRCTTWRIPAESARWLFHSQLERDRHGVADRKRTRHAFEIGGQSGHQRARELADLPPQRRVQRKWIEHDKGQRRHPPRKIASSGKASSEWQRQWPGRSDLGLIPLRTTMRATQAIRSMPVRSSRALDFVRMHACPSLQAFADQITPILPRSPDHNSTGAGHQHRGDQGYSHGRFIARTARKPASLPAD